MDWLETSKYHWCLGSNMSQMEHATTFQEGFLQEVEIDGFPHLNIPRENLDTLGRIWIKISNMSIKSNFP